MTTKYQLSNSLDSATEFTDNIEKSETLGKVFEILFLLGLLIGLFVLALLLFDILRTGLGQFLTPGFITETPSRFPEQGGIAPALMSSILLTKILYISNYFASDHDPATELYKILIYKHKAY